MFDKKQSGFTLIELAVVIGIIAVVIAGTAKLVSPYIFNSKIDLTKAKEENIAKVLASFAQTYGRLPCPADPNDPDPLFGWPRGSNGDPSNIASPSCGSSPANFRGILPFKALGLNEEQSKDSYGHYFTYAVSPGMTQYDAKNPTHSVTGADNTTQLQNACSGSTWLDSSGLQKNERKAHVCCPTPVTLGKLEVLDGIGGNSLAAIGPKRSTGAIGEKTQPANVWIKPAARYIPWYGGDSWREFEACDRRLNGEVGNYNECYFNSPDPYHQDQFFAASWSDNAVMTGRQHENHSGADQGDGQDRTSHEYALLKAVDDQGNAVPGVITVEEAADDYPVYERFQTMSYGDPGAGVEFGTQVSDNGPGAYIPTFYCDSTGHIGCQAGPTFYQADGNPLIEYRDTSDQNYHIYRTQSIAGSPPVGPRPRPNSVIVGRMHGGRDGQEQFTMYRTAYIYFKGEDGVHQRATLLDPIQSKLYGESQGEWFKTDGDRVMIDRIHLSAYHHGTRFPNGDADRGDAWKPTYYVSAKVHATGHVIPPPGPMDKMLAFILVSHGANGDGAYVRGSTRPTTAPSGSQDTRNDNNSWSDLTFVNRPISTAETTDYFDDIVLWRTNDQLITSYSNSSCAGP